ncbi:hypothetical protein E4U53_001807 [Claviceps sorghi]|nr:hypothetical protein E4U53_001807 [Claviceps sorghi]
MPRAPIVATTVNPAMGARHPTPATNDEASLESRQGSMQSVSASDRATSRPERRMRPWPIQGSGSKRVGDRSPLGRPAPRGTKTACHGVFVLKTGQPVRLMKV